MSYLSKKSREIQVKQVITRFAHNMPIKVSHKMENEFEDSLKQRLFGITIDLLSISWELLDNISVADLEFMLWIYFPYYEEVKAVSLKHRTRTLVNIPKLDPSMYIDSKVLIEDIEVFPDRVKNEIRIEAIVFIEGIVFEKCILHVLTDVLLCRNIPEVAERNLPKASLYFPMKINSLFSRFLNILRKNRK